MARPNRPPSATRVVRPVPSGPQAVDTERVGDRLIAEQNKRGKVTPPPKSSGWSKVPAVPNRSARTPGPAFDAGRRPRARVDETSGKSRAHVGGHEMGTSRGNR
jgi:hypothetical protein